MASRPPNDRIPLPISLTSQLSEKPSTQVILKTWPWHRHTPLARWRLRMAVMHQYPHGRAKVTRVSPMTWVLPFLSPCRWWWFICVRPPLPPSLGSDLSEYYPGLQTTSKALWDCFLIISQTKSKHDSIDQHDKAKYWCGLQDIENHFDRQGVMSSPGWPKSILMKDES